jgi:UDP-3-O-[3-hydroxymyristoyl] glucosamine N-acyltransferase
VTSSVGSDRPNGGERATLLTADDIARLVGGRVIGDADATVGAVAPLDRAGANDLSFLAAAKYAPLFARTRAGVVLIAPELADAAGDTRARVIVTQPHEALLALLPRLYVSPPRPRGIEPTARIGAGATLGQDVSIGPYVVLGAGARLGDRVWLEAHTVIGEGVTIGDDTHLYPGVTVYSGASLGRRVIVHAGARLGSDGFGYVFREGVHEKLPHVGRCVLEDDVEIGANTAIDRGSVDDTVIGAGTKIDNLVHVAHNVRIGKLCLVLAQVGIAGSARIEDGCVLAGQAGIAGHHTIGAGARVAAQAGVFGDVPAGETWSGYPARPHKEALRASAALFRLPALLKHLERLVAKEQGSA